MLSILVSSMVATAASGCLPGGSCPSDATSEAVHSLLQQQVGEMRRIQTKADQLPGFISNSLRALFTSSSGSRSGSSSSSRGKSEADSISAASAASAGITEATSSSVEVPPAAGPVPVVQEAASTDDVMRRAKTAEGEPLPDLEEAFQEVQGTVVRLHDGHDGTLRELEETSAKLESRYEALSNLAEDEKDSVINITLQKQAELARLVQNVHKIQQISSKLHHQDQSLGTELRRNVAMERSFLRHVRLEQDGIEAILKATVNVTTGVAVLVDEIRPNLSNLLGKMQGATALIQSTFPVLGADSQFGYSVSQPLPHLDTILNDVYTNAEVSDETAMQAEADFIKNHIGFALSEVETLLSEARVAMEKASNVRTNLSTARDHMYIASALFLGHAKSLREFCSGLQVQVKLFLAGNETSPVTAYQLSLLQDGAGLSEGLDNSADQNLQEPENFKLTAVGVTSPDDVSAIEQGADADFDEAKSFYLQRKKEYTVLIDGLEAQVAQLKATISTQRVQQKENQNKLAWATARSATLKDDFAKSSDYLRTVHDHLAVVDRFLVGTLEDPDFVRGVLVANHVLESTLNRPFKVWDPVNSTNTTIVDAPLVPPSLPMTSTWRQPTEPAGLLQIWQAVEPRPVVDMMAAIDALEASEQTAKAKLQSAFDTKMAGYHVNIKLLIEESMALEQEMAEQNLKYNKMLVYHIELENNVQSLKTELQGVEKFAGDMVHLIDSSL